MKKIRKNVVIGLIFGALLLIAGFAMVNLGGNLNADIDRKPAKYIFLFIGDGMGATHVATAESYLAYLDGENGFRQVSFTEFPVLGMAETYSANNNVTCSSAAGTAISCGEKTNNGWLGINAEGDTLTSVAKILKDRGYKVGILSSVPVNHATPAAFYAHNCSRHDYYGITAEIPESGYDFLGGSGFIDYFGKDGNSTGSEEMLEESGYAVCFGKKEYEEAVAEGAGKIVLCQEQSKGTEAKTYSTVGQAPGKDISSGEMLEKCISFFGDESPFFIMYEQGEIDWAAHGNRTMPMIESVLKLGKAVETALEFYYEHPDETLILVTADHETGGITLGATETRGEVNLNWEVMDSVWTASGREDKLDEEMNRSLNAKGHIGWTSNGHTGGPVPVYAIGKGAERFGGRYDNTDIKGKILAE